MVGHDGTDPVMPSSNRHRRSKRDIAYVTHLPATMPGRRRGGATPIAVTTLAYLAGMGGDTFGHRRVAPLRELPPRRPARLNRRALAAGTYWRRRFIVLIVGLVVFGLGAWELSSKLAVGASLARVGQHSRPGHSVAKTHRSQVTATRQPGTSAIPLAYCDRPDVVLSVFSGQTEVGARQPEVFDINVVSTQQAECLFNIGPRHVALVIADGQTQVWSSAVCAADSGGLVATLKRGVPKVLVISWDRQVGASGGCRRPSQVRAGTYTAYAVDGALLSAPLSFRLH